MKLCIYGAASNNIDKSYIEAGEALGKALAESGHGIVYGGGKNGMMGAVARGVASNKGEIIGVAPSFFLVDGVLFEDCTEFIYTETMRERKQIMEEKSDAFVVTPGGIGTFDEFFEIYSLRQLKRHSKKIIIFNINGYFNPLIDMLKASIEQHFVSPSNLDLLYVCDTVDEVLCAASAEETDDTAVEDLRSVMADK
ncbi:MAG: TIGR00730 family Rossman fold protein [Ruminococcaceae bacterium]|nr:TIGR00730 family Rossman fold protein [Oscillospiraceae bacterium]